MRIDEIGEKSMSITKTLKRLLFFFLININLGVLIIYYCVAIVYNIFVTCE